MDSLIIGLLTLQIQTANLSLQNLPQANVVEVKEIPPLDFKDYAQLIAEEHGLNAEKFKAVITCESRWQPGVRSLYILKNGKQENSWGLVQINLDDPPTGKGTVTKEQAIEPYWAIRYMAEMWDKGLEKRWSCYK